MKENDVVRACRDAVAECGGVVWRNNSGVARMRGFHVRFGLCPGAGDLIGMTALGTFLSVECKLPKGSVISQEQRDWIDIVKRRGGIAIFATCAADVIAALNHKEASE